MRIMIADDDAVTRGFLENALNKWGYEVVVAKDGNEAWAELQKDNSPDLIILGWMMPGHDGDEICRKLRKSETQNSKYVIMLTSIDSSEKSII